MARAASRRAGEDDAGACVIRDERGADRAVAGDELQRLAWNAGLMQQRDRLMRDERRLLGRLGDSAIAGDERGGDLAEENRQRKIPWRDADEDAAPAPAQTIVLAGRAGQRLLAAEDARLAGVIAAEIGGFAHFGERIVERLAALRPAAAR